jgi:hypothetical protein
MGLGTSDAKIDDWWLHASISTPDVACKYLNWSLDGTWKLHSECGTAQSMLHRKQPADEDVGLPPLYLFLDPTQSGDPTSFSHNPFRPHRSTTANSHSQPFQASAPQFEAPANSPHPASTIKRIGSKLFHRKPSLSLSSSSTGQITSATSVSPPTLEQPLNPNDPQLISSRPGNSNHSSHGPCQATPNQASRLNNISLEDNSSGAIPIIAAIAITTKKMKIWSLSHLVHSARLNKAPRTRCRSFGCLYQLAQLRQQVTLQITPMMGLLNNLISLLTWVSQHSLSKSRLPLAYPPRQLPNLPTILILFSYTRLQLR